MRNIVVALAFALTFGAVLLGSGIVILVETSPSAYAGGSP
jgi:hypothetical protein